MASLVAQAKMKHHHKWSSTDIKVGEYKIPEANEPNEYQRIVSGVQSVPQQPTLQATETTTSSPKADTNNSKETSNGEPEAKKAKKSSTNSDNPYPHIVTVTEVNTDGLTSSMIQKYFKPHRAIAVNVRAADKAADVAFKTHEAAMAAMEKQGEQLNSASCVLTLNSTQD